MNIPADELQRVQRLLETAEWVFAKTAVNNPHHYSLRRTWTNDLDFQFVAHFIRKYGIAERYPPTPKGALYTVLVIGEEKFWTMGFPIDPDPSVRASRNTILINRKKSDQI